MRIALDAMGADRGPQVLVRGAIDATHAYDLHVILVGHEPRLRRRLRAYGEESNPRLEIVHAAEVVGMGDKARDAIKRKDTSVNVAAALVRDGHADAMVSAGNTGAAKAAATLILGRLKGIKRPALATLFPTPSRPTLLLDVGATPDCKPEYLYQFAVMGNAYMRDIMSVARPRVGILSIGEEEGKGNELVTAAYKMLATSHLNFTGNAEGRDIVKGTFDVIVCDGFVGNSLLKFGESLGSMIFSMMKTEFKANPIHSVLAYMLSPAFKSFHKRIDWVEWGGAPLLGVNGACIIGHGSSCERAIKHAIRAASEVVAKGVNRHIIQELVTLQGAAAATAAASALAAQA